MVIVLVLLEDNDRLFKLQQLLSGSLLAFKVAGYEYFQVPNMLAIGSFLSLGDSIYRVKHALDISNRSPFIISSWSCEKLFQCMRLDNGAQ
ncbi:Unknown protein sequence [Pseudomonas amygdali pv. lachrymans]|nr:Unknown protein sequence [Pseudomonas amygdali pv. lachrymans]